MKQSKKCALLLDVLLILVMFSGCAGQPAQTPTPNASPLIAFRDCQLSSPGMTYAVSARFGKLPVFEDRSQKTGRKIDLGIAVIPAVSKNPLPDPLFLLAGGPGQAASESFPQLVPILERLHQKRDIVLVDQRGTGQSSPLRCPAPEQENQNADVAPSPESQDKTLKDCLAQLGADTRLYTTQATIEDLDQVRSALGYAQVNLIGISYGTRVAQAYQRQYPQNTRTVTLDGVNPLDWELGPENSANAQHALDLVFERCAADKACQGAFPELKKDFSTLLGKLDKQPAEVTLPHPTSGEIMTLRLTSSMVATTIQILLYAPESVALIPLLIHETLARSDYSLMAAQYLIVNDSLGQSIYDGLYLSVLCAEDAAFYPAEPVKSVSYLPDHTAEFRKQCAVWPHAQVLAGFKQPVKSDIPTLLLSGEADPITPPANAEHAASGFSNSTNLVVPGIGHNVIFRGCVPKILTSFIDTGSAKGLDISCIQEIRPTPFMINFSGSMP